VLAAFQVAQHHVQAELGSARRARDPRPPGPLTRPRAARPRSTRPRRPPVASSLGPTLATARGLPPGPPGPGPAPLRPLLDYGPTAKQHGFGSEGDRGLQRSPPPRGNRRSRASGWGSPGSRISGAQGDGVCPG
jgi:hypothetical protein